MTRLIMEEIINNKKSKMLFSRLAAVHVVTDDDKNMT